MTIHNNNKFTAKQIKIIPVIKYIYNKTETQNFINCYVLLRTIIDFKTTNQFN